MCVYHYDSLNCKDVCGRRDGSGNKLAPKVFLCKLKRRFSCSEL